MKLPPLGATRQPATVSSPRVIRYEPGNAGPIVTDVPFSGFDDREPSRCAQAGGSSSIRKTSGLTFGTTFITIRRPIDACDLARVIAALDERGARPVRLLAAV